jgi:hypothetical protein
MQFTQTHNELMLNQTMNRKFETAIDSMTKRLVLLPIFSITVLNDKLLYLIIHGKAFHMEFIPTMDIVSILL